RSIEFENADLELFGLFVAREREGAVLDTHLDDLAVPLTQIIVERDAASRLLRLPDHDTRTHPLFIHEIRQQPFDDHTTDGLKAIVRESDRLNAGNLNGSTGLPLF